MTFGILIFPGAHGDKELTIVLEEVYGKKVRAIWNQETNLNGVDVLFIPGGFPCKGSSNSSKCIKDSPDQFCRAWENFDRYREWIQGIV